MYSFKKILEDKRLGGIDKEMQNLSTEWMNSNKDKYLLSEMWNGNIGEVFKHVLVSDRLNENWLALAYVV